MILLNQNTINKVALTLAEKCTITTTTPSYLFQFVNTNSRETKLFTGTNFSTCKARYDLFDITLTSGTESLTGATISIEDGSYDYTIYSMVDPMNLQVSATTEIVEVGVVKVISSAITKSEFTNTKTNTIYYGN